MWNRPLPLLLLLPLALLGLAPSAGLLRAQVREDLQTVAEATHWVETSRYADVVALMEAAAEADDRIHLTSMGYTFEGRAIPLAVVGQGIGDGSPEAVRSSGKVRIYLQGNIHAGEVPGKEALQILLREVTEGRYDDWFREVVLLVAPLYNADGNERVNLTNRPRQHGPLAGMGQRPNAQGLDLNRDHTKLDSPEARSVAALFNAYDPHVAVDLHTTNGTRHAYHLTYSEPLNPATDPGVVALLREELLPAVSRGIEEDLGWHTYYYGNAYRPGGGEMGWYTFDHRPRFSNNYAGLRNRLGILGEAYAYATFQDRVRVTHAFVREIVAWAAAHPDRVREATEGADARAAEGALAGVALPLRAERAGSPEPVEILMGEVAEERNPWSGEVILRRLDRVHPTPMREFVTFTGTEEEVVPRAYLVPRALDSVAERLRAHGIALVAGADWVEGRTSGGVPPESFRAEGFRITGTESSERPFQGREEREVFGAWEPWEGSVALEDYWVVETRQPLARLAFYLLEPRSDDGFLNWALLDEALEGTELYPILRIPATRPAP